MKSKVLYIFFLLLSFSVTASGQRIVSELESNSDMRMDSRPDSTSSSSGKFVPSEVRAWTIDEKYGNIFDTYVDTLSHLFQNADLPEGKEGEYSGLGNVGSPRLSRIFMNRKPMSNFMFTDPFDMFFVDTEHFRFYNTKSPFLNVNYNWCGSKTTGDDHVKITYTNNAGKRVNIGGIFDYTYGQGYYDKQATSFINASAWASYLGDKYNFHFYYQHNFMKMAESGGITDLTYITNPENITGNFGTSDIPTYLSDTWNRQEHDIAFFNHHYNLGYYKEVTAETDSATAAKSDSTAIVERVFVPVSRIFHTFKLMKMAKNYRAYRETSNYHSYTYLPSDSTNDKSTNLSVKNLVGLSLCEGFNKWAVFGLNAYIGHELNRYTLPDTTAATIEGLPRPRLSEAKYTENNILVGGQILRTQGNIIRYNADAEFVVAGENIGQFEISGHGEANIPLLGDTVQIAANAYIKNLNPSFYFRHYHSKHAWWDIDTDKEMRQRIEGVVTIPKTHTKLTVGIENIKNYCYFQNTGTILNEGTPQQVVTNNVAPMQCGDNIQVMSINLRQNFALGILHLDNNFTYQTTSDKDVLPLPSISTYHNLYLKFKIAKVLKTELGADLKYFTEYYAPDYSPVLGMFMNQHEAKREKVGDYPIVSAYANFDLKRLRFYVQYYHLNQTTGRYLWLPNYPINPKGIHFGLSWNFYD